MTRKLNGSFVFENELKSTGNLLHESIVGGLLSLNRELDQL
jgi:hypothetical protein